MSIRTLLVPVTGNSEHVAALETAIKLAAEFASHLTALHVRPDPRSAIPFIGEGLTAEVVQDLCEAAEREGKLQADIARAQFEGLVEKYGISDEGDSTNDGTATVSWDEHVGFFAERLGRQARLADLTIVPQPSSDASGESNELMSEVLFRSGRPLMLAPKGVPETLASRVLVSWNGRAECARAVAAVLPMLRNAEAVSILHVGEETSERPTLAALKEYLGRHGVEAKVLEEEAGEGSVASTILNAATREGADALVMGAYSHNRWREMVLGGVTRYITDKANVPVFMSH